MLYFNDLLANDCSVSIHQQNLQKLAVEMNKVYSVLNHEIIKEIYPFKKGVIYELRQIYQFLIPSVHSVLNGTYSLKFPRPMI